MPTFPNLHLIGLPDNAAALAALDASAGHELLVLYDGNLDFLARVLNAAGYDSPAEQLHLLEWTQEKGGLDLSALIRQLGVSKVILFGQRLPDLGLHFLEYPYAPVEVAGCRYLVAQSVDVIAQAKANGNNKPAGALWGSIKDGFLREA